MSSILLYVLGFFVVIAGLAMAATLLGVDRSWIIVGTVVLIGILLISLASGIRNRH
jgi:hypothetical protein